MATETDTTTTAEHRSTGALAETFPLGMQWPTLDPFLFLAHHRDAYPAGTTELGPDAPLDGREIGSDFSGKDGWSMYHGSRAPGFPAHPHRGFETVTYVREGLIDHSDSLGATARFGRGDTQWMTAGSGIVHSEMFPLVNEDSDNPTELFQIWLNLPAGSKMADPYFTMLWGPEIPEVRFGGDGAAGTTVTVIAGDLQDAAAPAAPPDSWASRSDSAVAIWHIRMDPGARWTLPAAPSITDGARPAPPIARMLYAFEGDRVAVGGGLLEAGHGALLGTTGAVDLEAGDGGIELLLLQGRPLGEPVARYGPFVMNTRAEIQEAMLDYQQTGFVGWPRDSEDPVHPAEEARFARHPDGRVEHPD